MKIRWISHPHKPELNGTTEHVARELATVACGYGQAEYVQPARWGTPQWLEERKAQSAAVTAPGPEDVAVPFVSGVRWEIGKSYYGRPVIQRRSGFEIGQCDYGVIPTECPADLRKQYENLLKEFKVRAEATARERERALASGARF